MKKTKIIIIFLIIFSITLLITPTALPQKGTYTFHGAPGNQKILKVKTVNNVSLGNLWGENWTEVIEIFGAGAYEVGARKKSFVTAVNKDATYKGYDVTNYTTNNWKWTIGDFSSTPDDLSPFVVTSFYNPTELSAYINAYYLGFANVTVQNAGFFLAQLPTPVDDYLDAIVWNPRWEAIGNTAVHNGQIGDEVYSIYTNKTYTYLEDCTETWTYDRTYGAWIGYEIKDDQNNTIYKFYIDLPGGAEIPGYEFAVLISVSIAAFVGLIYIAMKKKHYK
ncbi:MAG: hypothetical protein ACFE91_16510 [Promethearchaeota archaeon]